MVARQRGMAVAVEEGEEEVVGQAVVGVAVRSWVGWMISEGRSARAVSDEEVVGDLDGILALWIRVLKGSTGAVKSFIEQQHVERETWPMKVCESHRFTFTARSFRVNNWFKKQNKRGRSSKESILARTGSSLTIDYKVETAPSMPVQKP